MGEPPIRTFGRRWLGETQKRGRRRSSGSAWCSGWRCCWERWRPAGERRRRGRARTGWARRWRSGSCARRRGACGARAGERAACAVRRRDAAARASAAPRQALARRRRSTAFARAPPRSRARRSPRASPSAPGSSASATAAGTTTSSILARPARGRPAAGDGQDRQRLRQPAVVPVRVMRRVAPTGHRGLDRGRRGRRPSASSRATCSGCRTRRWRPRGWRARCAGGLLARGAWRRPSAPRRRPPV